MKDKDIKLKSLLNETYGELPSSKLFKFNEATGKFEAPRKINEDLNDLNVHPWVARNMDELYKTLDMYINKNPKSIDFKSLKQLCTELVKQINQYHK